MSQKAIKKSSNPKIFFCEFCGYESSKKYNFEKHNKTIKHLQKVSSVSKNGNDHVRSKVGEKYNCEYCNKKYKTRGGLWKHQKICKKNQKKNQKNATFGFQPYIEKSSKTDIALIVKQVMEEYEKKNEVTIGNTTMGNHNTVNSNNTQNISINLFLNEHCKDALNLDDFVNKMKYTIQDVLNQQQSGYTKGIANVMVKNLKDLPVTERPIHCSDHKRGVFHVKDKEEGWVKEKGLEPGSKTMKACEKMNFKSVNGINTWQDENPNWQNDGNLMGERDKIAPKMYGPSDKYKANVAALKMVGEEVNIKDAIAEVSKNS
jgi:hypothetical protein